MKNEFAVKYQLQLNLSLYLSVQACSGKLSGGFWDTFTVLPTLANLFIIFMVPKIMLLSKYDSLGNLWFKWSMKYDMIRKWVFFKQKLRTLFWDLLPVEQIWFDSAMPFFIAAAQRGYQFFASLAPYCYLTPDVLMSKLLSPGPKSSPLSGSRLISCLTLKNDLPPHHFYTKASSRVPYELWISLLKLE